MKKILLVLLFLSSIVLLLFLEPAQNDLVQNDQTQILFTKPEETAAVSTTSETAATEATQAAVDPVSEHAAQIQTYIESIAEKYGAIGLQVAVVNDGNVAGSFACGWATVDQTPMTTDHKIRVASISKVFVGIAAMLLQEDGLLDIDTDISQYWDTSIYNPYYPDTPITVRMLLNHTSTLTSYGDDYPTDPQSILYRMQNGGFQNLLPGAASSRYYNNYAFRVLGVTLEKIAQQRLDDILAENLFSVMDIDASFASGDIADVDLLATLYRHSGAIARSVASQQAIHQDSDPAVSGTYFAGGLTTSVNDLAKITALLAADGVYEGIQLLSSDSVDLMESCLSTVSGSGFYQGLPLCYVPELYGREGIYYHPGCAYGVYSCLSYDSSTGDGVVVVSTGADGAEAGYDIYAICDEINTYLYDLIL